jgi:hypothetical protein
VACILHDQVLNHHGKIHKLFGKKFILWTKCWPEINRMVIEDNEQSHAIETDLLMYYLDNFGTSLSEPVHDQGDPTSSTISDAILIWSPNFYEALNERRNQRLERIHDRNNDDNDMIVSEESPNDTY